MNLGKLAALPDPPGIGTGGTMVWIVEAPRKTVWGLGGQLIRINLAEFFVDLLSLVMLAADPGIALGMGEFAGAMGFREEARPKTEVLGRVDGQFIRIDAGIHAALANGAGRSEHGDDQHSNHGDFHRV